MTSADSLDQNYMEITNTSFYAITSKSSLISLSTLVLNSRDWSEILWLPEISRFKITLQ